MIDFFKSKKFQRSLTVMAIASWVIVPLWPSNLWPANQNTGYDPNSNIVKHIQANSSLTNTQNYSTNQNGSESSNADTQIQNLQIDIQNKESDRQFNLDEAQLYKSIDTSGSSSGLDCSSIINSETAGYPGISGEKGMNGGIDDAYQQCLDNQKIIDNSNKSLENTQKSFNQQSSSYLEKAKQDALDIAQDKKMILELQNR